MPEPGRSRFPLFLDLSKRQVCIFGAGTVGLRKARLLAPHARVRVVSDAFLPEFSDLPVERVRARVEDPSEYLGGAFLVVPATDDEALNARIVQAARAEGRFVDAVQGEGDAHVPAIIRRGDLVVALSTSGASPALARYLGEQLEEVLDPAWEAMLDLQRRLRNLMQARIPSQRRRAEGLRNCLEDDVLWTALRRGDEDVAWRRALDVAGLNEAEDPPLEP